MDERTLRFRVGVVVLIAAIITGILVTRLGDMPFPGTSTYEVSVLFPTAPGVTVGTPVRKSGVSIGRVTQVELMKPSGVRVSTDIDSRYVILDSELCRIATASVLGDAVLEFVPGNAVVANPQQLTDGSEIQNGVVAGNPLDVLVNLETDMRIALRSIQEASNRVGQTASNLNAVVANNDDQLPRLFQKTEKALDQFNTTMSTINTVFGDPELRDGMKQSLNDVPKLLAEARVTLQNANEAFEGFKSVSERADRNLANLENFTKPLGERGGQIAENLDGSLSNVNQLLEQLVEFTDGLNSREGTLGRLMNDGELYDRLNRTLANAEDITSRIKPILDDVRIFSDKIARDPRQLGVKGAIDRRPLGVGTKPAVYNDGESYEPFTIDQTSWDSTPFPQE
ncbi:Mammalian cell entry related domain protein [Pirellula staleyi DSM 6068]|uniref:Mammalian cell entry related domain protein n=1 Tax=Pirellula staleyi (strain ATCC 27377 / DSM 6068 / ICPB 4128) TaxID=530564 RepID=D2R1T9_PIRSD|nr:MlaD family protein [Pirellula staleyi]ADB16808.1 Mammalian cell entry related domain protein [Pirellula staleyi DSM 6068]